MKMMRNTAFPSILAPFAMRKEIISLSPFLAARWRGVKFFVEFELDKNNDEFRCCIDICPVLDEERDNLEGPILSCSMERR
jgi:hypothetical protein